jgi:imidazolonepropionase-like amidohydrolase
LKPIHGNACIWLLTWLIGTGVSASEARSQGNPDPAPPDQGKFILHKFEQPIGEETFVTTREGNSLDVKVNFKFTDRGREVPLKAEFRGSEDLTPESFTIKGNNARAVSIDEEVEVQRENLRIRDRDHWTDAARPEKFFTISGYAPATLQMLMYRYWATHGSPVELAIFPNGTLKVEPRGTDIVSIKGKNETLERVTVEGLIWGRETLWFDAERNLIAAVTVDAEFDHFEAIRDGYEEGLGAFVARAGVDGMSALAEISRGISGSRAKTMAFVGGTLIDGTGRDAVADSVVVIHDGRIAAAGPRAKTKIPKNATIIDTKGKTVLPGLWDMHAHFEQVEWGPIYLAAGATTVRDCGNEFEFITAVRDAIANGRGLGPRLLLAGIVDGTGPRALGVARVDTPEQAREWVKRYRDAGFQQMKIYSSVKLEELKIVAEEAHRRGMSVTGHVPEGLTPYQTLDAGQDQINHIQYVADMMHPPLPAGASREDRRKALVNIDLQSPDSQKAVAFLKEHKTVVDPTLAIYEFITANTSKPPASIEPGVTKVAPELRQELLDVGPPSPTAADEEKALEKEIAIVGILHRAGIPIVAGTDQTVPGYSLYREMELYVQAGFTPMEAIQAATIVPARVMGINKEVGTVEKGKRADLIVVDGNPLNSIHEIRKVESVITNGTLYNCAELWETVGFQP